jgi:hypothetical protein
METMNDVQLYHLPQVLPLELCHPSCRGRYSTVDQHLEESSLRRSKGMGSGSGSRSSRAALAWTVYHSTDPSSLECKSLLAEERAHVFLALTHPPVSGPRPHRRSRTATSIVDCPLNLSIQRRAWYMTGTSPLVLVSTLRGREPLKPSLHHPQLCPQQSCITHIPPQRRACGLHRYVTPPGRLEASSSEFVGVLGEMTSRILYCFCFPARLAGMGSGRET